MRRAARALDRAEEPRVRERGKQVRQIFSRLGSAVTIDEALDRVLPPEDPDSGAAIAEALADEGVRVITGAEAVKAERSGGMRPRVEQLLGAPGGG